MQNLIINRYVLLCARVKAAYMDSRQVIARGLEVVNMLTESGRKVPRASWKEIRQLHPVEADPQMRHSQKSMLPRSSARTQAPRGASDLPADALGLGLCALVLTFPIRFCAGTSRAHHARYVLRCCAKGPSSTSERHLMRGTKPGHRLPTCKRRHLRPGHLDSSEMWFRERMARPRVRARSAGARLEI